MQFKIHKNFITANFPKIKTFASNDGYDRLDFKILANT